MRLINTRTLHLEEFPRQDVPEYAILSHTWEKEEVLFSDMADLSRAREKAGFAKIQGACRMAAAHGHDYIWIDTCCIDKSSSAEVSSEAINSMYRWYERSEVCYAYLCDVKDPKDESQLVSSRWFTRGWTLQELLAPNRVELYTADWSYIGGKYEPNFVPILSRASLGGRVRAGRCHHAVGSQRGETDVLGLDSDNHPDRGPSVLHDGTLQCQHARGLWRGKQGLHPSPA
ncbi:hypothetical protein VTG60DRAFT_4627 [Thermothelomyces hinnuleus]